jgi:uncharacterized membrane protein YgcG
MPRIPSIRLTLLALFVFSAAALAFPAPALAGTLEIRDESHVLTPDAAGRLRSTVASEPFDARLAFTSEYADAQDFSRYVGSLIHKPDMIAVGIDPKHRHVEVHFGTGSGIARGEWSTIERAGNEAFHGGDWEAGATAIFKTAARSVSGVAEAPLTGREPGTSAAQRPGVGSGAVLVLIALVVVGVIGLLTFLGRRRAVGDYGAGYGSGYGSGYGPGYGPGPYGAPPPQGGMGPLGGGLIGAGLGGLAGYELGKMEGEREERMREGERVIDEGAGAPDDNFDAGGGGSSWDDDGGGGGFDGGGGDSSGGSDF